MVKYCSHVAKSMLCGYARGAEFLYDVIASWSSFISENLTTWTPTVELSSIIPAGILFHHSVLPFYVLLELVNNVAVPSTGSINNGKKQNGANHTKHQHGRLLIRVKHIPGKPLRHNGRRLHPARSSFDQPRQTCRISTTRHPGLKLVLVRFKKLSEF